MIIYLLCSGQLGSCPLTACSVRKLKIQNIKSQSTSVNHTCTVKVRNQISYYWPKFV